MVLLAWRSATRVARVMVVNLGLTVGFAGILFSDSPILQLWVPVIFFWWAYRWAGQTLHTFHPPEFSLDQRIIGWEERFLGQPSLWWARRGGPWLTEILHFFYFTYYWYTPVLGIFLYREARLREFEAMTFAVLVGYAVSYVFYAVTPASGPRWALVEVGLLDPSEQQLEGYWFTRIIHFIMYRGLALKGGSLPSAHSATAMVFLVWCWKLGGVWAGAPAAILVIGMCVGSIYGRYHYAFDVACGALLGLASLWLASLVIPV